MLHRDFTDFSRVVQIAHPDLVSCPKATVYEAAAMAFSKLCERTQCYKEEIQFDASLGELELISPHESAQIVGVDELIIDEKELMAGEFVANSPTLISFTPGSVGKVIVNLKPTYDAQLAPASLINAYADEISNGVKARLMMNAKMPWSEPELGQMYTAIFERDCLRIAADVRNQFSISRTGRKAYTRSVYGV